MQDIYQKLSKDYSIDELVENLVNVPGEEIAKLLTELDINFPRSIRFNALQRILFPVLELEYNELLKSDSDAEGPERLEESRRQTRLRWIDSFSETQFENELFRFSEKVIDRKYLFDFWKRLINFLIREGISKNILASFIEKAIHKYGSNQATPPVRLFNKAVEPFIYEEDGTFDGLTRELFAKRVVLSATISEIKQIGSKFGIKVPTRLTKTQVLAIIIDELKSRNEYIPEVHEELNEFNLKELEDFARLNNIIAFAYINKDQMIEYMYKEFDEKAPKAKRFLQDEEIVAQLEEEISEIEEKIEVITETKKPEPVIQEIEIEDEVISDIEEPIEEPVEEVKIEEKSKEELLVEVPAAMVYDSKGIDELKIDILSLKEVILELQRQVDQLQENSTQSNTKLDKISKGLIPRWVKRTILVLFIIFMFFFIYIPLSYYYPNAPVVSQISYVFRRIPFFGRDFLTFLHALFRKIVGL